MIHYAKEAVLFLTGRTSADALLRMMMGAFGICFYWLLLDPVLPVTEGDLPGGSPIVRDVDGGQRDVVISARGMEVTRMVCSARDIDVVVERYLVAAAEIQMPATRTHLQKGCHTRTGRVNAPPFLPTNVWFEYRVVLRRCNPLRCETTQLNSINIAYEGTYPPGERPVPPVPDSNF